MKFPRYSGTVPIRLQLLSTLGNQLTTCKYVAQ